MKIEMYTQDGCTYCNAAIREFETRSWKYVARNIKHEDNFNDLKERLPDVKTVPQIWIDDQYIGGYNELLEWLFVPTNAKSPNEIE